MTELDEVTLQHAMKGDHRAFKKLYDFYVPFVWKSLFFMTNRNQETARELIQDTFVKAYRGLGSFKDKSAFSTWLYRIAYTTTISYFRRNRTDHFSFIEPDTIEGSYTTDDYDHTELTEKILSSLTAEDRFLLAAREFDNVDFDQLSSITGHTQGALRTKLHRIKDKIRKSFPQECLTSKGELFNE